MNTRETMHRLNDMLAAIEASYMTVARANGLSYNALMLLLMLAGGGNITQKQVCQALYLPKSSVHSMLSGLIARGYLTLSAGGNRKEKYIVPTADGTALIQKAAAETERMESRTLASLSERETAAFLDTAQRLTRRLAREAAALYGEDGVV